MAASFSRRDFNGLMVSGAAAVGLGVGRSLAKAPDTGDVDWTSDDPHLSGNYLPVAREVDAANLAVISGRIPRDLSGAYMRTILLTTWTRACATFCLGDNLPKSVSCFRLSMKLDFDRTT
jgi:hypothetical protein